MPLQEATTEASDKVPQPELESLQPDDGDAHLSRRRLTRRARWVLIIALALLLAGAAAGAWAVFFRDPASETTYRTVTVSAGPLKQTVSATGTLNPAQESDLSFSSSGTVESVAVSAGDLVAKGDELATIDDSELEIDYDSAKASLTEAKESLSELEDDDDATDAAIAAAEAGVKVKKNDVKQAKAALEDAALVSPISGKVAEVNISEGDTVSGTSGGSSSPASSNSSAAPNTGSADTGSDSTSSTTAITVISNGTFTVTTSVSNADVASIKKGLQATITPTGSTEPVYGTVSSVGVVASSSSGTTGSSSGSSTFPVTIKVTGTHKTLLPGSTATVAITVKQLTNVISVPTQAVSTSDGKTVVQKLVDGKQVATEVKLGTSVGSSTVITSGLANGDQVVLPGFRAPDGAGAGAGQGQGGGFPAGGFPGGGFPGGGVPAQGQGQQQGGQ